MQTATPTARRHATMPPAGRFSVPEKSFSECRQRLISYLVKLNHALDDGLADLSQALLSRFCDSLIDYLSAGHFRVFRRVALPAHSYVLIEATTQAAIDFHDRFGDLSAFDVTDVKQALEPIAHLLCTRFELEDELLYTELH